MPGLSAKYASVVVPETLESSLKLTGWVLETLGGWDLIAVRQFGATKVDGVQLRFAGSVQRDDTGEVSAVEIVARGRHEEIDFGEATPGEDTEHKINTALSYYKLSVDGEVLVEIDLLNFVYIVNGKDLLAAHRKALGI